MLSVLIGTTLGIISGFIGGLTDTFVSRLMDVFGLSAAGIGHCPGRRLSRPGVRPQGNQLRIALLIFIIGFFSWPYIGRIIRGRRSR